MKKMSIIDWIALVLVIIGGLNWGLVGAFKYDLVAKIFGDMAVISRIVYDLVGLSAIWMIVKAAMGGESKSSATPTAPTM
jgi:uncharacterized membrane protein YuzA (DUF378 family)